MVERFTAPSAGRGSPVQLLPTGRESGEWVRHSDYAELEAEMERLRKKNEYLEDRNEECEHWRIHWKTKTFEALSRTGAVKVKALEWEDREERRLGATTEKFWRAQTAFDWGYRVKSYGKGFSFGDAESYPTVDAAKAAAQADYERRILSALEPAAPEDQPVAENPGLAGARALASERLASVADVRIPGGPTLALTRPSEQAVTEEWREIKQHVQPRIADGYTAVAISKPGYWLVKGPGPAAALKAAMEAGRHD